MTVMHESSRTERQDTPPATRVTTLAALMDAIDAEASLSQKRRADTRSAIRSLASVAGLPVESTPCDPRLLAERLRNVSAATARMSPRRFANRKSLADAALAFADRHFGRRRDSAEIAPDFAALLKLVPSKWDRLRLRRLFHFAAERDVTPAEIDGKVFDEFGRSLDRSTIVNPRTFDSVARQAWNWMCSATKEWPGKPVAAPSLSITGCCRRRRSRPRCGLIWMPISRCG